MGHYNEGSIRCFEPDNDDKTLYISCGNCGSFGFDIEQIIDQARGHFQNPDLGVEDITISAEHIHTRCLGYDQYDPSDHTNYLVITLVK